MIAAQMFACHEHWIASEQQRKFLLEARAFEPSRKALTHLRHALDALNRQAMGYRNRYLVRVVLEQAALSGLAGWIPAWLLSLLLYSVVGAVALLPMRMTWEITLISLLLTLGMCLISAVLAVRRVIAADPAEVF
jgi:putative ABC transport system permease protein